mmetsp:Transcript_13907/g.39436  ORF Transcript_13907/g.39436 Transcript_13907/m.39436 type:complete len:235 (-) Transcript_13907:153-857(-)
MGSTNVGQLEIGLPRHAQGSTPHAGEKQRREDHQHGQPARSEGGAHLCALLHRQGWDHRVYPDPITGDRRQEGKRQLCRPRRHLHTDPRGRAQGGPRRDRAGHPEEAHRRGRRRGAVLRLPGLQGRGPHCRADDQPERGGRLLLTGRADGAPPLAAGPPPPPPPPPPAPLSPPLPLPCGRDPRRVACAPAGGIRHDGSRRAGLDAPALPVGAPGRLRLMGAGAVGTSVHILTPL